MNGCIYRTKDNECELWTDDKHKSFCDVNCTDRHPSNADRVRAMTDEELATEIWTWNCVRAMKREKILDLLKQEAE